QYKIKNDGIIIPKEDLARIGERFFRTDKARNRTTGGTGLGLSIVKEIVRLHDGTFTIKSSPTTGTIVIIQLPYLTMEGMENDSCKSVLLSSLSFVYYCCQLVMEINLMRRRLTHFHLSIKMKGHSVQNN